MAQQGGEHAKCRQQVGTAHQIGYRFGKHRMQRPQSAEEDRQAGTLEDGQPKKVDQHDVVGVEEEIDRVIPVRVGAVAQHRIVEQERERAQRTIEAGIRRGPILPGQDAVNLHRCDRLNARVLEDDPVVIQQKWSVERVGVSQPGKADDRGQQERTSYSRPGRKADGPVPGVPRRRFGCFIVSQGYSVLE